MAIEYLNLPEPKFGVPCQVATGIWWIRLPIDLALDHVNIYVLQNQSGLTLIDTGLDQPACYQNLVSALKHEVFSNQKLNQVIVTHYHPDHIGLAGRLCASLRNDSPKTKDDISFLTTETCYHAVHQLHADQAVFAEEKQLNFRREAGIGSLELEAFRRRKRKRYCDSVAKPPIDCEYISNSQTIEIGERRWTAHFGQGHAKDHLTLWSDDGLALVGDQVLPAISPNLSVHYSDPDADCIRPWLESCNEFANKLNDQVLCLPGHQRPFFGAGQRCKKLAANSQQLIEQTIEALRRPQTIISLLPTIYRRNFDDHQRSLFIGEMRAVLNYLHQSGLVTRRKNTQGAFVWRKQ